MHIRPQRCGGGSVQTKIAYIVINYVYPHRTTIIAKIDIDVRNINENKNSLNIQNNFVLVFMSPSGRHVKINRYHLIIHKIFAFSVYRT